MASKRRRGPLTPNMIRQLVAENIRCCERVVDDAHARVAGWRSGEYEPLGPDYDAYLAAMDEWLPGVRAGYARCLRLTAQARGAASAGTA